MDGFAKLLAHGLRLGSKVEMTQKSLLRLETERTARITSKARELRLSWELRDIQVLEHVGM